jgi:hypothetical protein
MPSQIRFAANAMAKIVTTRPDRRKYSELARVRCCRCSQTAARGSDGNKGDKVCGAVAGREKIDISVSYPAH